MRQIPFFQTLTFLAWLAFLLLPLSAAADPPPLPVLVFAAPAELKTLAASLEELDRQPLVDIMELVGLEDPGPPIRILLAPEGSPEAKRAPSWGVGYAVGAAGLIVLLPARVPGYPDKTLEEVYWHELAHVLIARAANRRDIPRWFNEGLAIHAARDWRFDDRTQLLYAAFDRDSVTLGGLNHRFYGGADSAARAYALSGAFVRHLLTVYGDDIAALILARIGQGEAFAAAFQQMTGTSLIEAERLFWRDIDFWNRWIPLLTSSATLWIVITVLALWAFKRRRERDEAQREIWEEEERRWFEEQATDKWVN